MAIELLHCKTIFVIHHTDCGGQAAVKHADLLESKVRFCPCAKLQPKLPKQGLLSHYTAEIAFRSHHDIEVTKDCTLTSESKVCGGGLCLCCCMFTRLSSCLAALQSKGIEHSRM